MPQEKLLTGQLQGTTIEVVFQANGTPEHGKSMSVEPPVMVQWYDPDQWFKVIPSWFGTMVFQADNVLNILNVGWKVPQMPRIS